MKAIFRTKPIPLDRHEYMRFILIDIKGNDAIESISFADSIDKSFFEATQGIDLESNHIILSVSWDASRSADPSVSPDKMRQGIEDSLGGATSDKFISECLEQYPEALKMLIRMVSKSQGAPS